MFIYVTAFPTRNPLWIMTPFLSLSEEDDVYVQPYLVESEKRLVFKNFYCSPSVIELNLIYLFFDYIVWDCGTKGALVF